MSRTTVLFGPPGTGKTTAVLQRVEEALSAGVPPDRIVLCAFTRKAANEAIERMIQRFGGDPTDYPWIRTLHSIAYRLLGLKRNDVMNTKDYKILGSALGMPFQYDYDEGIERIPAGGALGDKVMRLYSLARAKETSIEAEWETGDHEIELWHAQDMVRAMEEYKRHNNKLDFCDMVDECHIPLKTQLFIVDEAQDLTNQQWALARRLGVKAEKVLLAGDDDQAIFEWAGAAANRLQAFEGERIILPKSYRLPEKVWKLTRTIGNEIKKSVPKTWTHNGHTGQVDFIRDLSEVDFSSGEWLILCRHAKACRWAGHEVKRLGYVYHLAGEWSNQTEEVRAVLAYEALRSGNSINRSEARLLENFIRLRRHALGDLQSFIWDDFQFPEGIDKTVSWMTALNLSTEQREYIRDLRANGESLTKPGRIRISTIHTSKGGEADNVVLLATAGHRVRAEVETDPDPELRVWYVAVSRARKSLYILSTSDRHTFYQFLSLPI